MRQPVNRLTGDALLKKIKAGLPSYAKEHVEATFVGHYPEAAFSLMSAAPNEWRGIIALSAYWLGLPNPAYREIIEFVWSHDHRRLMRAARGGTPQVRRMIAAAEFPIPIRGNAVPVYRGVFNIDAATAARGLAWTTSRDIACWFAFKWICPPDSHSFVLKAIVDPSEIIYWSNQRKEHEVILRRPPAAMLDDKPDWSEVADRVAKARAREKMARLKRYAARAADK